MWCPRAIPETKCHLRGEIRTRKGIEVSVQQLGIVSCEAVDSRSAIFGSVLKPEDVCPRCSVRGATGPKRCVPLYSKSCQEAMEWSQSLFLSPCIIYLYLFLCSIDTTSSPARLRRQEHDDYDHNRYNHRFSDPTVQLRPPDALNPKLLDLSYIRNQLMCVLPTSLS